MKAAKHYFKILSRALVSPKAQLSSRCYLPVVCDSRGHRSISTSRTLRLASAPSDLSQDGSRTQSFTAAPEIDLDNFQPSFQQSGGRRDSRSGSSDKNPLKSARVVPASPAYFSGRPHFTDDFLILQNLLDKYQTLPTVPTGEARRVAWHTLESYRSTYDEPIRVSRYNKIIALLGRLNRIHPTLMPQDVFTALNRWERDIQPFGNRTNPIEIDEFGRAVAIGRRKSASAKAWVVLGDGQVLVNDKPLHQAFGRVHDRESAVWPLKITGRLDKYNVYALVTGGGTTGQAEAVTLAVAKALMAHEPLLKPALRKAGCITRDPRRVERKKPGRLKARKRPTWTKR